MKIFTRAQIEKALSLPTVLKAIEQGFLTYSEGGAVIPPVGTLHFDHPPGDCHIKYGYAKNGDHYVVKIASSFPDNEKQGLPSGNGIILLFDKHTGSPLAVMQDEGYMTDLRTAAAGCIAARYLAPKDVTCIGIVGTGAQAYYQLKFLAFATPCRRVMIWGRAASKAKKLKNHPDFADWEIETADSLDLLAAECKLIVTATASTAPLLFSHQIRPGTHITALGADDRGKQELDPAIFSKAEKIIVDSRSQCIEFGDVSYAVKNGTIKKEQLIELGEVIRDRALGRTSDDQITVADLTGVAIQDLMIATALFTEFKA